MSDMHTTGQEWDGAPPDVDLGRVWRAVATEVWRRQPSWLERRAARWLGSPGLARALLTTPSLLVAWLISTVVVLAVGAAATVGTGLPLVALLAPAVAGAGIAYAYGPGMDPAWELSCSMAVNDRMVLLVRALAVFAVNAALGAGSRCRVRSGRVGHLRLARPHDSGVGTGLGRGDSRPLGERGRGGGNGWLGNHSLRGPGKFGPVERGDHRLGPSGSLPDLRGRLRRCGDSCYPCSKRSVMNIDTDQLTRSFGRTQAVAGVDLQVGPGVFGLLGPNGAGKTSLLRMMATVLQPSSGSLQLLGRDPANYGQRREIRRRLGYLPQNLGYYPGFTVVEFVEYFALLKEMPPARIPAAVATAVERVELGEKARSKLRTLSGGMLRRVGIAQAIVNDPELLLLDEPTAGLDPEQRVQFRAVLRELGETATVVVSTHLVEDVGAACTEVALMDRGIIVFRGTPDELTARGVGHGLGDAPLERGYSAVLAEGRA